MKFKANTFVTILSSAGMLILILDSKLVFHYTSIGINMCLQSIIPALFPFLFVSGILTDSIMANKSTNSSKISKLLKIPSGTEYLLLLGFLGGYPNGALHISQLYENKSLNRQDAERMLPIYNQAGPAFIFGMLPCLFSSLWFPFVLWIIQIISALITLAILPGKSESLICHHTQNQRKITTVLQTAVRTMSIICGWVVLFKIIIGFAEQRIITTLPNTLKIIVTGILELSNGIFSLHTTSSEFTRFVLTSAFLSFGGLCVLLQAKSVVKNLSLQIYVLGKILQLLIASFISVIIFPFVSSHQNLSMVFIFGICLLLFFLIVIFIAVLKKTVAIPKYMLYNKKKSDSEVLV